MKSSIFVPKDVSAIFQYYHKKCVHYQYECGYNWLLHSCAVLGYLLSLFKVYLKTNVTTNHDYSDQYWNHDYSDQYWNHDY